MCAALNPDQFVSGIWNYPSDYLGVRIKKQLSTFRQ